MKKVLDFLTELQSNNNKDWFSAHKKDYEQAKKEFSTYLEQVLQEMEAFETGTSNLTVSSCMFRINRDIRFSTDKSPYKINFGASINVFGKKSPKAGYYIHVQPNASFVGGGMYMPEPEVLKSVRQEIDYNLEDFEAILTNEKFKHIYPNLISDDKLQRPPKGYEADNKAIEYLKNKHFACLHNLSDSELLGKEIVPKTVESFQVLQPFIKFLNKSLE
ncbi:MAG: DUF2461 domain-containing protein [Cytophagales bacterium]